MSRLKAYFLMASTALIGSLVAGVTFHDVFRQYAYSSREASEAVLAVEKALFFAIAGGPAKLLEVLGVSWGYATHIGAWPYSWPFGAAIQLQLVLVIVPFWTLVGVVVFEAVRFRKRSLQHGRRAA